MRGAATLGLTHSAWINAWSLRRACAACGVDLRVAADLPRELPLPRLPEGRPPQWLFFTEEASLRRALQPPASPADGDADASPPRYWPRHYPLALLDDKWAFAAWLAEDAGGPQGLRQWALAEAAQARFPLLLKARHSWAGSTKLPRGWVCRDAAELARCRAGLEAQGLDERWFFLQAWLGDAPLRLSSVGGFFDAADEGRNLAVLTERVADYGEGASGPSSSAMLVTVPDAMGLIPRAERALRRLRYTGPYEFEFIVVGDAALALELNPRFWMQHGLFAASGDGLVRRYLGLDGPADRGAAPPERLLWVDGVWLLRRLVRLDRRALGTLAHWWLKRRHRPLVCPTPGYLLRTALWRLAGRLGRARGAVA